MKAMNTPQYPIFISYRRADTADKAEHLLSLLEAAGYKGRVSFDRENLDGRFDLEILKRLDACTDFIVVLGTHTLDNLKDEDAGWYQQLAHCTADEFPIIEAEMKSAGVPLDFVRLEIARALAKGKHIIPVVPVNTADYNFDKLSLPDDICLLLKQHNEKYQDSKNFLFKEIVPKIVKRLITRPHQWRWLKRLGVAVLVFLIVLGALLGFRWSQEREMFAQCCTSADFLQMKNGTCLFYAESCEDSINAFETLKGNGYTAINDALNTDCKDSILVKWSNECSLNQIRVLKKLVNNMILVPKGDFMMGTENPIGHEGNPHMVKMEHDYYIGKFEVSEREWYVVMSDSLSGSENLPMANVSFEDCQDFVQRLRHLTGNLVFAIPTEEQWEYAARYKEEEGWSYAGGAHPKDVAYFEENAEGTPHWEGKSPNALELYNMSGNVAEWCSDGNWDSSKQMVRGGAYDCGADLITTTYADAASVETRFPQLGLRLVLFK